MSWSNTSKNASSASNTSKQYADYAGGTSYVVGDEVIYQNNLYRCILASSGNLPTNTTYWTPLWANTSKN